MQRRAPSSSFCCKFCCCDMKSVIAAGLSFVSCVYSFLPNPVFDRTMPKHGSKTKKTDKKGHGTLFCEWNGCDETFDDPSLFLSHINHQHGFKYGSDTTRCHWKDCPDTSFQSGEHFTLHLSFHAYHHKLKSIGRRLMEKTEPRPVCSLVVPHLNEIVDTPILICGWQDCLGEFFNVEEFIQHVGQHALEDASTTLQCQWIDCPHKEPFKILKYLKEHLGSHSQKKEMACPTCGRLFVSSKVFLDHCYNQMTPVDIVSNSNAMQVDETETNNDVPATSSIVTHQVGSQSTLPSTSLATDATLPPAAAASRVLANLPVNTLKDNLTIVMDGAQQPTPQSQQQPSPGNTEYQYKCDQCPKSFPTRSLYRRHQNRHAPKWSCPYDSCNFKGVYESRLNEHIAFRHTKECKFPCNMCEQSFKTKSLLQGHVNVHNRTYECGVCKNAFTTPSKLREHHLRSHLQIKSKFACTWCTKVFTRGGNLTRHITDEHASVRMINGYTRFSYQLGNDGVHRVNPKCCEMK